MPKKTPAPSPPLDPYEQLTPKQKAFVDAYLTDPNATKAAELAGYQGSATTLAQVGAENLRKPQIVAALVARQSVIQSKRILNAQEVQEHLSAIAVDEGERTKDRIAALNTLAKIKIPELRQRSHELDLGDKSRTSVTAWIASVLRALRGGDRGGPPSPG